MSTAILLALLVPVQPQVSVSGGIQVEAHVPTIQFEAAPALMVVAPGVMVVPDQDREVFFADGFYWYNMSGAWFRTRSHRGGWVRVAYARVPQPIIRLPRGKFIRFRGGKLYRRAARPPVRVRPVVRVSKHKKARVVHAKKARASKKTRAHASSKKKARASKKTRAHASKKKARASVKKARSARAVRSRKVRSARAAPARRRTSH